MFSPMRNPGRYEELDETELGLILEHQVDSELDEFLQLVEEMKICLHQMGWNYDGWLAEEYDRFDGGVGNVSIH